MASTPPRQNQPQRFYKSIAHSLSIDSSITKSRISDLEIQRKAEKMGSLGAILTHPDDIYPLLKLKMAVRHAEKQIPPEPHWAFCYTLLHKVSRSFGLVIQQLGTELRNAVSFFFENFVSEIFLFFLLVRY